MIKKRGWSPYDINRKQPFKRRWGDGFWQGIGYWRNRTRKAQEENLRGS